MIVVLFLYQEQRLWCDCFYFLFNFLNQYYYYNAPHSWKKIKEKIGNRKIYELSILFKNLLIEKIFIYEINMNIKVLLACKSLGISKTSSKWNKSVWSFVK